MGADPAEGVVGGVGRDDPLRVREDDVHEQRHRLYQRAAGAAPPPRAERGGAAERGLGVGVAVVRPAGGGDVRLDRRRQQLAAGGLRRACRAGSRRRVASQRFEVGGEEAGDVSWALGARRVARRGAAPARPPAVLARRPLRRRRACGGDRGSPRPLLAPLAALGHGGVDLAV